MQNMKDRILRSEVKTYTYPNGEIQRVQVVTCRRWEDVYWLRTEITPAAFESIGVVYQAEMAETDPERFGEMVVFHIPEDVALPFTVPGVTDPHTAARLYLTEHFDTPEAQAFLAELDRRGWVYCAKGRRNVPRVMIPYDRGIGFLSQTAQDAALRSNCNFFTFELEDCDSPYDVFGTPLGMAVKDGVVLNPPLFGREALLIDRQGRSRIAVPDVAALDTGIPGTVYQRPACRVTPAADTGTDVVIIGCKVAAVRPGGGTVVPSSGFVVHTERTDLQPGTPIVYRGMEDVLFGIQVGNSIVSGGQKTGTFTSPFYDIFKPDPVSYPPARYPLNFGKDRAPRTAIGADGEGHPVFLWAEGSGKFSYRPGVDSCGASLSEMAEIAADLGLVDAVHLDGGGSSQLIVHGEKALQISGRYREDNSEKERPIPAFLAVL